MNLFITDKAKAAMNVNKEGEIYLEVFKPIGRVNVIVKENRPAESKPLFYDKEKGLKDSKVLKLSVNELSLLIEGVNAFLQGGVKVFQQFANECLSTDRFTARNLIFSHETRNGGLAARVWEEKKKEYIGFIIYDAKDKAQGQQTDRSGEYSIYTDKKTEIYGLLAKLTAIRDASIKVDIDRELSFHKDKESPILDEQKKTTGGFRRR
ncbi:MAG: hypothetical protein DDT19_01036 [Syntrophomonadaceae bacterium]|nr:hypothetical protein [Bacillota bacterium]